MNSMVKFQDLLLNLFILDSYDLDFGIYRAFNYKMNLIKKYIRQDLKHAVESAFDKHKHSDKKDMKMKVLQDLHNFFSKYFKGGELISAFTKAYSNKDVKLIWSNQDQYYVKTLINGKNVEDYFIHKDIKKILVQQLESFVKDEILSLDVITKDFFSSEYITRAKLVTEIGIDIINVISVFEERHKNFWLKKKFILETDYIITIDKIPEDFYDIMLNNEQQLKDWDALGFKIPTSIKELGEVKLPVDTKYFNQEFKEMLLERLTEYDDLDDIVDGIIIKSENWQALNLLMDRFKNKIKKIYIDPPYNTGKEESIYRDSYSHSSWITMMDNRLRLAKDLLKDDGIIFISIDENEVNHLKTLADDIFPVFKEYFIWLQSAGINYGDITVLNEFLLAYTNTDKFKFSLEGGYREVISRITKVNHRRFRIRFPKGLRYEGIDACFTGRVSGAREPIDIISDKMVFRNGILAEDVVLEAEWSSPIIINKLLNGESTYDRRGQEYIEIFFSRSGVPQYRKINRAVQINNILHNKICGDSKKATFQMRDLFNEDVINNPKPVELIYYLTKISTSPKDCYILDFFAGSGTTAHAVINLNKEDNGKRKFILVEKADYFDTVIIPRIKKIAYSTKWKNGNPRDTDGMGGIYKYHVLEQYEDALDNTILKGYDIADNCSEDNFLKYYINDEDEILSDTIKLNIKRFYNPFSYKLKVNFKELGEYKEKTIDIVETFNYLLGLKLKKFKVRKNENQKYVFILGEKDGENTAVIWRNFRESWDNEDYLKDREFIVKEIREWNPDVIYINGNSMLCSKIGELDVDLRYIEPEFSRLMGFLLS